MTVWEQERRDAPTPLLAGRDAFAEKTEAMVRLVLPNSRLKDFFDIRRLALTHLFEGDLMRAAVTATLIDGRSRSLQMCPLP